MMIVKAGLTALKTHSEAVTRDDAAVDQTCGFTPFPDLPSQTTAAVFLRLGYLVKSQYLTFDGHSTRNVGGVGLCGNVNVGVKERKGRRCP